MRANNPRMAMRVVSRPTITNRVAMTIHCRPTGIFNTMLTPPVSNMATATALTTRAISSIPRDR